MLVHIMGEKGQKTNFPVQYIVTSGEDKATQGKEQEQCK